MAKYDEEAAILFQDVGKTYKGGIVALDGINISIDQGEFVFITGASGAGKSTLMKLLTAEERATEGAVWLEDINVGALNKDLIPYYRRKIGMVFQDYRLIASKTVFENVAFAMESVGQPSYEIVKRVPLLLAMVGLGDRMNAYPGELSGGEAQRVGIARAMANTPRLLVADEPTGNLDPQTSESIMTLLDDINRTGTMVITCTHDLNIVKKMNKRVIEMSYGQIIYDSAEETTLHITEEAWDEDFSEEEYPSYAGMISPLPKPKSQDRVQIAVSTRQTPPPPPPPPRVEERASISSTTVSDRPLPPPPPRMEERASISSTSVSDRPLPPPPPRMAVQSISPATSPRPLPPPRLEVETCNTASTAQTLPPPPPRAKVPPVSPSSLPQPADLSETEPADLSGTEHAGLAETEPAALADTNLATPVRSARGVPIQLLGSAVTDPSAEISLYAILDPSLDPSQDASLNPFLDPDSYPALDPTWGQFTDSRKGVIKYEV